MRHYGDSMNRGNKGIIVALIVSVSAVLSGCSGNSDELDEKLTHTVKMSFINSLAYMADFHVSKRNISTGYTGLFDSKNIASSDVKANDISSVYNYSYDAINNMVNLGVKDSINANQEKRITTNLSNGNHLWVIAWESSGSSTLSAINKKQHNTPDVFNVRLFANGNYDVSVDDTAILTTEKGIVTDYLAVSNCANSLKVAGNTIDLCTGNISSSYLLVVDGNGKRVMTEE